jgi:S-adenosylmethionine decarboxylase
MHSWGLHTLIDGITSDVERVKDTANVAEFVSRLVKDIDMVAYGPLWIDHFATHDPEKAGISFCQMIETSNITGHFVDKDGTFYIDIFSCKDYEIRTVLGLVEEFFGASGTDLNVRIVHRQAPRK